VKKTYVVDTLYGDLIDRYAKAEGVELKDVVTWPSMSFLSGDTIYQGSSHERWPPMWRSPHEPAKAPNPEARPTP
jgi:hypothetical protein